MNLKTIRKNLRARGAARVTEIATPQPSAEIPAALVRPMRSYYDGKSEPVISRETYAQHAQTDPHARFGE